MKFLIILICAGVAVWFFCFRSPGESSKAPESGSSSGGTVENIFEQPAVPCEYEDDSLGKRLAELAEDSRFNCFLDSRVAFANAEIGKLRDFVRKHSAALPEARKLVKYEMLGVKSASISVNTLLSHSGVFSNVQSILTASGFVNAADGKFAAAEKDFIAAAKIQHSFLVGTRCLVDLHRVNRARLRLIQAVRSSNMPSQYQRSCSAMIIDQTHYSAVLPHILSVESGTAIKIISAIKANQQIPENDFGQEAIQAVRELSMGDIRDLMKKGCDQLSYEFMCGNLRKNTVFSENEKEDMVFKSFIAFDGYLRVFQSL